MIGRGGHDGIEAVTHPRMHRQSVLLPVAVLVLLLLVELMTNQHHINLLSWDGNVTRAAVPEVPANSSVALKDVHLSSASLSLQHTYVTPSPAFLVYYSHAGYSNQLMGLQNAAQLAYKLNRTLVVAPVLPHQGDKPEQFPNWGMGTAGAACVAYRNWQIMQVKTLNQATRATRENGRYGRFPSFHSIMDFGTLYSTTGLGVIDLDEFMQQKHKRTNIMTALANESSFKGDFDYQSYNTSIHTWCNANLDRNVTGKIVAGKCQINPTRPYPKLVEYIQQQLSLQGQTEEMWKGAVYKHDCSVVNIGSGFVLRNNFHQDAMAPAFARFFDNYPLVNPWNDILKTLLEPIMTSSPRQRILGVHVRTKDGQKECMDSADLFKKAAAQIMKLANKSSSSSSNNNNTKDIVIIGRVHNNSKLCLQQALHQEILHGGWNGTSTATTDSDEVRVEPTVMTVNDLIDQHVNKTQLDQWIGSIQLEVSTRFLLLDQFVLALASKLILQSAYAGSTFQQLIKRRHAYRSENLQALGLMSFLEE